MFSEPNRNQLDADRMTPRLADSPVSFALPQPISSQQSVPAMLVHDPLPVENEGEQGWLLWLMVVPLVVGFTALVVGPLFFGFF